MGIAAASASGVRDSCAETLACYVMFGFPRVSSCCVASLAARKVRQTATVRSFLFCSGSRVGGVDGTRSQDQKKAGKMPKYIWR